MCVCVRCIKEVNPTNIVVNLIENSFKVTIFPASCQNTCSGIPPLEDSKEVRLKQMMTVLIITTDVMSNCIAVNIYIYIYIYYYYYQI